MEIKRAWAICRATYSFNHEYLHSVHGTSEGAGAVLRTLHGLTEMYEVVVAVDGDQCTILGKWEPVRFTQ